MVKPDVHAYSAGHHECSEGQPKAMIAQKSCAEPYWQKDKYG
jgi:hypothetical protein